MIQYLLISQLALALAYLLYQKRFAPLPYYRINRVYLLVVPVLCALLPLLDFSSFLPFFPVWELPWEGLETAHTFFPPEAYPTLPVPDATRSHGGHVEWLFPILVSLYGLLTIGLALVRGRIWWQSARFLALASPYREAGKHVFFHPELRHSCTFFHRIYVGQDFMRLDAEGQRFLLQHEAAHARLGHGWDLLYLQLWEVLLWWNPLIYRWKTQLQTLHEFQADQRAAPALSDLKAYAQVLLSLQAGATQTPFPAFSAHPLTVRILMLTKQFHPSSSWKRYFWVLPAVVTLLSFSAFMQVPSAVIPLERVLEAPAPLVPGGNLPTTKPVPGQLTSSYGMRIHPILKERRMHRGVDFKAPMGTPVKAAGDGIVSRVIYNNEGEGYGKFILIDHQNGYISQYAQLSEFKVKVGQQVNQGDVIALSGNSGASTAPHLHFEIRYQGEPVDPMTLLK